MTLILTLLLLAGWMLLWTLTGIDATNVALYFIATLIVLGVRVVAAKLALAHLITEHRLERLGAQVLREL